MRLSRVAAIIVALSSAVFDGGAMQITNYNATVNDRFASGFPGSPVENASLSFVGVVYDWSGVGWATSDGTQGFGFLSPRHYLMASHYPGPASVSLLGANGLVSATRQSVTATGTGIVLGGQPDISIGTLLAPIGTPAAIPRYAVLDLNPTSATNSTTPYTNLNVLLYGRGPNGTSSPRIGATTSTFVNYQDIGLTFVTPRSAVQLEVGDSGSPAFHGWTNPNGSSELTLVGLNSAIDTTNGYNLLSFFGTSTVMNAMNTVMVPTGYALRVAGNPTGSWLGGNGSVSQQNDLFRSGNWSNAATPADVYSLFNGSTTSTFNIDVNSSGSIRGLSFRATAADDGFTFAGANTLTIGRGGLTNYDNSRQTISANVALGDHQFWDFGSGGVTLQNVVTNGRLLELQGTGTAIIQGTISGSGGLSLTGGRLELTGISNYTATTWVHAGTLHVTGSIASSTGVVLGAEGRVSGSGTIASLSGSGSVDPGNSPGILTSSSLNPSGGMDFQFEFTQTGSPDWSNAAASGNDVLRLTGVTPFSQALTSANAIQVFIGIASLSAGDVFRGGFFTDREIDFLSEIQSAAYFFYLLNPEGATIYNDFSYSLYSGPFTFELLTVSATADFSTGTEEGFVTQITVVPEPSVFTLLLLACGASLVGIRRISLHRTA